VELSMNELFQNRHMQNNVLSTERYTFKRKDRKITPYFNFLGDYLKMLETEYHETFEMDLADLASVENLIIQGFTLDLSVLDNDYVDRNRRSKLSNFLDKCLKSTIIKHVAAFGKDREVISTEQFRCVYATYFKDKKKLNYLRFIVYVKLFLYENKILLLYENNYSRFVVLPECEKELQRRIWSECLETMHERIDTLIEILFNECEKEMIQILLNLLRDNSKDENETMSSIYNLHMWDVTRPINMLKEFLPNIPEKVGHFSIFNSSLIAVTHVKDFSEDVNEMLKSTMHIWNQKK